MEKSYAERGGKFMCVRKVRENNCKWWLIPERRGGKLFFKLENYFDINQPEMTCSTLFLLGYYGFFVILCLVMKCV